MPDTMPDSLVINKTQSLLQGAQFSKRDKEVITTQ